MTVTVDTPPTRRRTRLATWVAIGLGILVIGSFGAVLAENGRWDERTALDPESAGPNGARAVVEILRDHGVDVRVVHDHTTAERELTGAGDTLVMLDTPALSDDGVRRVVDAATDVVLIDPRARTLDIVLPGSAPAGYGAGDAVEPACGFDIAERAGAIAPGALFGVTDSDVAACYPVGDGWGLISAPRDGGDAFAVDGRVLFTNEHLAQEGNAALAIGMMGRHSTLVWYLPNAGDTDLPATDLSLGELTPPWVSPVIVLLLVAGVAAGIWRGRRFGPLVAERLPVTVRASETTEGRARMYAHARDAGHAADELRRAALRRIARALHLGVGTDVRDIADAAASVTGADRATVHRLLIDDVPTSDAELVRMHENLTRFEAAVDTAAHPERNSP